jgi:hypothetical protein
MPLHPQSRRTRRLFPGQKSGSNLSESPTFCFFAAGRGQRRCFKPPAPKAGVLPLGSPSFSILLLKAKDLAKEFGSGKMCEHVTPHAWSPPNSPHSESQAKMRLLAPQ